MKKTSLLVVLFILVLSACASSSEGRDRSASQPGGTQEIFLPFVTNGPKQVVFPEPLETVDQFMIGIQTKVFEPTQNAWFSAVQYYPVEEIVHTNESLDRLIYDLDSTSDVLYALGHNVANMEAVEPLGETVGPNNWVIFYPGDSGQTITEWVQYKYETKDDGRQETLAIEFNVDEAVSFAAAETLSAQVESLIAARNGRYNPDTKSGTFVDMVLVQMTDAQGIKSWILYNFRPREDAPGVPGDADDRFCCHWLNCAYASHGYWARVCTFWDCVGRCR